VIRRSILLQVAFWGALAVAVVMATLPHPPHTPLDQFGDKVEHMTAFGVMAALAAASYPRASLLRIGERLSFLGALIEVVQSIPALHRDCDIMDWVADTAAIIAVLLLVAVIRQRRRS
jgi:hypothetical protein